MEYFCEKAEQLVSGQTKHSALSSAERFEALVIYLNDTLTIVNMYDEEFTPFITDKIKENVEGLDNADQALESA
jgi:hypothetical protein